MLNHECLDLKEDQVAALDKCLKKLDLDRLLGGLFEFIETYVKHSPQNVFERQS